MRRQQLPAPSPSSAATTPTRPPRSTPRTGGSSPTSASSAAPWCRSARCRRTSRRRSSRPKTSASTSTTGSTGYRVFGAIKNNLFKFRGGRGVLDHHHAARAEPLARGHQPARQDRSAASSARRSRPRDRGASTPRTRSSSSTSTRSTWATAPTASRPPRQRYFGKSVRDLNVAEAATLAAIPKAPSRYNPRKNPNLSVQRRNTVLNLLRDNGCSPPTRPSGGRRIRCCSRSRSDFSGVAEYFVEYVRQQLDARFGADLYKLGYRIYTTLDLDMQQAAERALEAQLEAIESGADGKFAWPSLPPVPRRAGRHAADNGEQDDHALPAGPGGHARGQDRQHPRDGGRARLRGQQVQPRHPGARGSPARPSSRIVYAAAVEAGYPLSHVMVDDPLTVEIATDTTTWAPQNYDLEFDGPMTLRRALYMSRNIIAIKLGMELGEDAVVSEATKFGITTRITAVSVDPHRLRRRDPAGDDRGLHHLRQPRRRARCPTRSSGSRTAPARSSGSRRSRSVSVMDTPHAWLMTDVLRDVVRHGTAVGSVGSRINFPAGGKTGTTNDGYDVWFIGFTPDLVTGIWIGFDQPKKIKANAQGGRARGAGLDRDDARGVRAPARFRRRGRGPTGSPRSTSTRPPATRPRRSARRTCTTSSRSFPAPSRPPSVPIHSPFGAVGGTGPLGGTGTAPDGAPLPTAPLPPGAARPACPRPARPRAPGRRRPG